MALSFFDSAHWAASAFIEVVVLALVLRRGASRQLPFFTVYLALLVASEAARWLAYEFAGISSKISFDTYWATQGILILARAVVVYEICRVLLSPYTGIWRFCRPPLIMLALVLATSAALTARQRVNPIPETILMAERGLELTVVGILIFGMIFCRYYGVRIDRHLAWIALGLGFYSAVQVANNTFLGSWFTHEHFQIWNGLRMASFNIATILWFMALRKPLPALRPAPVLLARGEYESLAPQVTLRLRELNARLLEMWK